MNKKITQDWKNKMSNSTVGKSYHQNIKHPNISAYRYIPRELQTFGARATLGHKVIQSYLYKFRLSPSPLCTLCQQQAETLEHILVDCPIKLQDIHRMSTDLKMILNDNTFWTTAEQVSRRHRAIGWQLEAHKKKKSKVPRPHAEDHKKERGMQAKMTQDIHSTGTWVIMCSHTEDGHFEHLKTA